MKTCEQIVTAERLGSEWEFGCCRRSLGGEEESEGVTLLFAQNFVDLKTVLSF